MDSFWTRAHNCLRLRSLTTTLLVHSDNPVRLVIRGCAGSAHRDTLLDKRAADVACLAGGLVRRVAQVSRVHRRQAVFGVRAAVAALVRAGRLARRADLHTDLSQRAAVRTGDLSEMSVETKLWWRLLVY